MKKLLQVFFDNQNGVYTPYNKSQMSNYQFLGRIICFCVCLSWNFKPSKAWNFNPSKAWKQLFVIVFRRVEISSFRRVEIKRQNRWLKLKELLKTHQKHIKKTTFSDVFLLCFASENPLLFLMRGLYVIKIWCLFDIFLDCILKMRGLKITYVEFLLILKNYVSKYSPTLKTKSRDI